LVMVRTSAAATASGWRGNTGAYFKAKAQAQNLGVAVVETGSLGFLHDMEIAHEGSEPEDPRFSDRYRKTCGDREARSVEPASAHVKCVSIQPRGAGVKRVAGANIVWTAEAQTSAKGPRCTEIAQ